MTSAPQPNEIGYGIDAALEARGLDPDAVDDEQERQPKYAGDMPDDPERAAHYRPGEDDQPDEHDRPGEDDG
jgi:hypothetical protein